MRERKGRSGRKDFVVKRQRVGCGDRFSILAAIRRGLDKRPAGNAFPVPQQRRTLSGDSYRLSPEAVPRSRSPSPRAGRKRVSLPLHGRHVEARRVDGGRHIHRLDRSRCPKTRLDLSPRPTPTPCSTREQRPRPLWSSPFIPSVWRRARPGGASAIHPPPAKGPKGGELSRFVSRVSVSRVSTGGQDFVSRRDAVSCPSTALANRKRG